MRTAAELHVMSRRELMRVLCEGHPIDATELDDTEYLGTSLGLPAIAVKLSWKTFVKTFHRDPEMGHLRGWNVRMVQGDPPGAAPRPMMKRGAPFTFGHYRVVPAAGYRTPAPCDRGLMIDYGLGGNAALDFMGLMRDPLVAVNPGESDLLLGWSYVELGLARLGTPSFFTLERAGALSHRADPPRRARG